ncbi:MAG: DUF1073 domain-containing protein [Nitratireductor sp.]|nr:DUF1073 domain-containing protein [Nitratireductor sp.]
MSDSTPMKAFDGLINLVSNLGTKKDKATQNKILAGFNDYNTLDNMWRGSWMGRKCVEVIPDDMLRQWRTWEMSEEQVKKIERLETALRIKRHIRKALVFRRVFGGGVILLGTGTDKPETELRLDKIKEGDLKYLHTFHRFQLTAAGDDAYERDIRKPNYGRPKKYQLTNITGQEQVEIHPSRLVIFDGMEVTDEARELQDGFGDSIFDAIADAVLTAASVHAGIASLVQEAKIDVYKVRNLAEMVSNTDGTNRLTKRFMVANMLKSINNALILDEGEEHEQKTISFSGLKDTMLEFMQVVAGAADIPMTRFLGMSPGGMNSTGEGDLRNYYDNIQARQENELRPDLEPLDEALLRSAGIVTGEEGLEELKGETAEHYYRFDPLFQPTAKEKAEVDKARAEITKIYKDTGLVDPMVLATGVKNQLIEDGPYPGIDAAYEEHDADLETIRIAAEGEQENADLLLEANRKAVEEEPEGSGDPAGDK